MGAGAFAQVHKRFFNRDGKVIKDSAKAFTSIMYTKEGPDSAWSVIWLDKHGLPLRKGTFLDEELTIPHGKFIYYQILLEQNRIEDHSSSIDTVIRVEHSGYYNNGKKEGTWMYYHRNGIKSVLKTYDADIENGLYELYDDEGHVTSRGYLVNGYIVGDYYHFRSDSSISRIEKFFKGIMYKYTDFGKNDILYRAYAGYNFNYHVARYLKKIGVPPSHGIVVVDFTVDKEGRVINPVIKLGINPILDEAIIEAVKKCSRWTPASLNRKVIEQQISLAFNYDTNSDE